MDMSLINSFPESIGTVICSIVTTAFNLGILARDIADAPDHIQRICAEAETCRATVLSLKILLLDNEKYSSGKDAQELIYVSHLLRVLLACEETFHLLEVEVEDLVKENMSIGKDERARWVWREEKINKLLRCLESHKLTLNVTLSVLTLHHTQELKKQNAQILNYILGDDGERVDGAQAAGSTQLRQRSRSLSIIPEELESCQELEVMANTTTPPKQTALLEDDIYAITTGAITSSESSLQPLPNCNSFEAILSNSNFTSACDIAFHRSFEDVLFASRVYKTRKMGLTPRPLRSNMTWSELTRSGASILSYKLRTPLSSPSVLVATRAPLAILTKDPKRLNDAFINAVKRQDTKAMGMLLEHGAKIEPEEIEEPKRRGKGWSPLGWACASRKCNRSVVKLILGHGGDANGKFSNGRTPLHEAASSQNVDAVELLLAHGANTEEADNEDETPIFEAVRGAIKRSEQAIRVIKLLVQAGANVRKKNKYGKTPLHLAAASGSAAIVKLLLDHNAEVDALDQGNNSPLFRVNSLEAAKILIESGANINMQNMFRRTPLMAACHRWASNDLVQFLLEHGAELEAVDSTGQSALFFAVKNQKHNVVQTLLDAGANCTRKDSWGRTPLNVVRQEFSLGPNAAWKMVVLLEAAARRCL